MITAFFLGFLLGGLVMWPHHDGKDPWDWRD